MFENRKLLIASKHQKEQVIAPLCQQYLGVICEVATDYDTDKLGTFSGEVERHLSPLDTVKEKCVQSLKYYKDIDLVIASEGSFGPHPSIPFIYADEEVIMLHDKRTPLTIWHSVVSVNTNFSQSDISSEEDILQFNRKVGFPAHGVILKVLHNNTVSFFKDIQEEKILLNIFNEYNAQDALVSIQTDMRAMNNPTRMSVIGEAIKGLIEKINSKCPSCGAPGYAISDYILGLPCRLCARPTRSVLKAIYTCVACTHQQEIIYPYGKIMEDPGRCDFCNP